MKFYIATRLERALDHNLVRDTLVVRGHEITYDWTHHGSVQRDGTTRIREVSLAEKRGVLAADFVVVLLPGGRGTHVELGMAIAAGKPVILHTQDDELLDTTNNRTCVFYHDPLVFHAPSIDLAHLWSLCQRQIWAPF